MQKVAGNSFVFFFYLVIQSQICTGRDMINQSTKVSVGETLISAGQVFELGFFSPGNSGKQYVGIWYKQIPVRKVVWVANREKPLMVSGSSSGLTIGQDGNLKLIDGKVVLWSTNVSASSNNSVAVLLDQGNLVLRNGVTGETLWESFKHPGHVVLPEMKIGMDTKTGEKLFISSWLTEDDPSPGKFVSGFTSEKPPQVFVSKGPTLYWRSGPWNGFRFVGMTGFSGPFLNGFSFVPQAEQENQYYFKFTLFNTSNVRIVYLTPDGALKAVEYDEGLKEWNTAYDALTSACDVYGACGPYGVCNKHKFPICMCMKGFVPKSVEEWSRGNWTSGCMRRTELLCEKNKGESPFGIGKTDGFLKFSGMKLPDHTIYVPLDHATACRAWCLSNCSCLAYARITGIGCTTWAGDLLDSQELSVGGQDLFIRLANSELGENKKRVRLLVIISAVSCITILGVVVYGLWRRKANQKGKRRKGKHFGFSDVFVTGRFSWRGNPRRNGLKEEGASELQMLDLEKIVVATNGFSISHKLGEGGFGPVFKGLLEDGKEIAVKRLSRCSEQGLEEFKNEIILISKLQHKNLVRLLGCCTEGEELLIVYEYMPNRSLDTFLFDETRSAQLDWAKRFNIIQGIARGLVYLHRDSCLKIIHRDLKVSNILLDKDMNAKISDFGLARTFQGTQEVEKTRKVVGTFGYMSPEYAFHGTFSEKSDVFSFGVLLLEIISGKKSSSYRNYEKDLSLLGHAWELFIEEKPLDFLDQTLASSFSPSEVTRCIHVGLLCVQDHQADRPMMSAVVVMLSSETDRPLPKKPTFTCQSTLDFDLHSKYNNVCSINEVTISEVSGR